MIHYYSRSKTDNSHLYKHDDETNQFWYMDHCWTGEGVWYLRDYPPAFEIVEITPYQALEISKGNLEGIKQSKSSEIKVGDCTFIGEKAEDSAKYYKRQLSEEHTEDIIYLAWDAAHKFGSQVIGSFFSSFRHGIIKGANASAASAAFETAWKDAFHKCPQEGRKKAMKQISNQIIHLIEEQFGVTVHVFDNYYY